MAYNLENRFPSNPKYYRIFEPGAYQNDYGWKIKTNKVPFLSATPRKTQFGGKVWTDNIYDTAIPPKIPNITSMTSRVPRFPYEALSKEDLEQILCRCGFEATCECSVDGEEEVVVCQGKVPKRIIIGPPCRRDSNSQILCKGDKDGTQKRKKNEVEPSPPFYDARVKESTAFYQGCKWSMWTQSRSTKPLEKRPGPADYTIERQLTKGEICAEKLRAYKRKTSKQYRYIELVQRKNILEGRPGPATYNPELQKYMNIKWTDPKAERFLAQELAPGPGPGDYNVKRDFDPPNPPDKPCHATLPEPACFGMKAKRFRPQKEEGPSPASYNTKFKLCHIMKCPTAPFGSSSVRFKQDVIEQSDDDSQDECFKKEPKEPCPTHTWEFKSKTVRLKHLTKNQGPSPADVPQSGLNTKRPAKLQYGAPFFSSEGRFRPWYNWIPVHGLLATPAPYSAEKPKCPPAVPRGPLVRSRRFSYQESYPSPGPSDYYINNGIETVLSTYNTKLLHNMNNQHTHQWKPPVEKRKLSQEEKKTLLIKKCIDICDVEQNNMDKKEPKSEQEETNNKNNNEKPKLLRYFLHLHEVKPCS